MTTLMLHMAIFGGLWLTCHLHRAGERKRRMRARQARVMDTVAAQRLCDEWMMKRLLVECQRSRIYLEAFKAESCRVAIWKRYKHLSAAELSRLEQCFGVRLVKCPCGRCGKTQRMTIVPTDSKN